jgi:transposase-like protein
MSADLFGEFRDERSAYRFVESCIWPDGPVCPHCGGTQRVGPLRGRTTPAGAYKCYHCRKSFTVKIGTIFELSHVPLHKWLQALYLTDYGAEPIRPHHLGEILNVTFKTAAFMISRIHSAAARSDWAPPLSPEPVERPLRDPRCGSTSTSRVPTTADLEDELQD